MRILTGVLVIFGLCGQAFAQAELCEPYTKGVRLTFDTTFMEPTYNRSLPIKEVRQLYSRPGQRIGSTHNNAIGITYAEVALSLSASTRSMPRQRGGYCVYLEEVRANFGFEKFEVYIGREYLPGTCEYRTILDHENEHVAINNAVVREYGPRIRRSIEQQLSMMPPLFAPSVDTGARRAVQELQQRVEPVISSFKREQRRRNAAIDTQEAYGVLQELCSDWAKYRNF